MEVPSRKQCVLIPRSIDEFVGPKHRVRLIVDVVERLDLRAFASEELESGRPPYPPVVMVSVLLFAFSVGVFTSREIERRLETDLAFMFAAAGLKPSYRTIARFRRANPEALSEVFTQVLVVCRKAGLGDLGVVTVDGTRVRANASLDAHSRREQLEKELERAREHVKRLLDEAARQDALDDARDDGRDDAPPSVEDVRKRATAIEQAIAELEAKGERELNTTDPDARLQRLKEGNRPGYNAQIAVAQDGLIVGSDVTNDPSDMAQLIPMVDQVEQNVGPADVYVADSGYESGENVKTLVERGRDAVIASAAARAAVAQFRQTGRPQWIHFEHDPNTDSYLCPGGRVLPLVRETPKARIYRCPDCSGCPLQEVCAPKRPRELTLLPTTPYLQAMSERREVDRSGPRLGARRKALVEGHFGHFKHNLRWRQFRGRGRVVCRAEFRLLCAAYNLTKLWLRGAHPQA